ncbi:M16 family metallopeptidase [Dyella silvatica]|uniref:M16 family metallopeptidase n=1 Tax=Dyella silvatica TaxID=2992128 RepID=UPI002253585D|nr:pitrilysin family protein [Dyella silvatica]
MTIMKKPALLVVALGLCMTSLVQASTAPLPKDLPAYGPDKAVPVPDIAQRTLANGLTVWVVSRNGLPKVDMTLAVLGGTAADDPSTPALSSVMTGLLNAGTTSLDAKQIAESLQAMGGDYDATARPDAIVVSATALSAYTAELLHLVADTALHPSFPAAEVALQKANSLQVLKVREGDPAWQAQRAFDAATFGTHAYARSSLTEASIAAVTPETMRQLHAARFRPDRSLLVIIGRISTKDAFRIAEQQFGSWKAEGKAVADMPQAPRDASPQRLLVTREGSVQTNIRYGRPALAASDPDFVPLNVANTILGGGFTSRLTQDIREDKGYSYSPRSMINANRAGGSSLARVDVRNEVTGATLTELNKLYESMASQRPSDEELIGAKRLAAGTYLLRNQIQASLALTLANYWAQGLPPAFFSNYVTETNQVNGDQVQAMGRKYFAPKDQSIILVGDPKAIEAQLKPFGEFKSFKP